MTTTEIRKIVASSTDPNYFNSLEVTLRYPKINFFQKLTGITSIHKFLSQQMKGWEKYGDNIPSVLNSSSQHFGTLKTRIENFVNNNKNRDTNGLNNIWRQELGQIQKQGNFLVYDCPQTEFLIRVHKLFPTAINGAWSYIMGQPNANLNVNNRDNLVGAILAYEFDLKDHTEITKRRNAEKSSISKIRNDLRNQLSESETDLVDYLKSTNNKFDEYTERIDSLKEEKDKLFTNWFEGNDEVEGVKLMFNNWFEGDEEQNGAKQKIEKLEYIYEEQLRLKKPAKYWRDRAGDLKKEGWSAVKLLMGLVAIGIVTLYLLLWLTPDGMIESFTTGDVGTAIKWSVIYLTFISFLAYGIRVFYKIAFSAFHLRRDAEEREQLTYVYLSLLNDSAIEKEEKNLILKSLFSRADTGLLKGDSSPVMPNNDLVGKVFGSQS